MNISFRDIERISAFLDNELSQAEKSRLELRLSTEPELAVELEELHQVRTFLRSTPQHRVPRNFTLTRRMAGIKPPVPRSVPLFSWASAVALLLFVFTLGGNLVGKISFGAAAPMMVQAPVTKNGVGGGPADTEAPSESSDRVYMTATPEITTFTLVEPPTAQEASSEVAQQDITNPSVNPWLVVWPATAALFVGAALLIRGINIRTFRRKSKEN
jgi:hypothetical protein